MQGVSLSSFSQELYRVEDEFNKNPARAIVSVDEKFGKMNDFLDLFSCPKFSFPDDCHKLPFDYLKGFSFDDLCKMYYFDGFNMHRSVDDLFKKDHQFEIVRKLHSSMWRWGSGCDCWNDLVCAYDAIRSFDLNLYGFEIMLDYTTGYNPRGRSKYSRISLDGVFAFLIYTKGRHVMTVSFSIQKGRNVLINQVQMTQKKGNRFLYKLPCDILQLVITIFAKNFSGHQLWLIDGNSLFDRIVSECQEGLRRVTEGYKSYIYNVPEQSQSLEILEEHKDNINYFKTKIDSIKSDKSRLAKFYSNVGKFVLGESKVVNEILFRKVDLELSVGAIAG